MLMINKGCSTGSLKMAIQAMPGLFTFPSSVIVPSLTAVSLVKTFSGWRPERVHPTSIRAVVMFWDCDCGSQYFCSFFLTFCGLMLGFSPVPVCTVRHRLYLAFILCSTLSCFRSHVKSLLVKTQHFLLCCFTLLAVILRQCRGDRDKPADCRPN